MKVLFLAAAFGVLSYVLFSALYTLLGPPETLAQLWFGSALLTLWAVGAVVLGAVAFRVLFGEE